MATSSGLHMQEGVGFIQFFPYTTSAFDKPVLHRPSDFRIANFDYSGLVTELYLAREGNTNLENLQPLYWHQEPECQVDTFGDYLNENMAFGEINSLGGVYPAKVLVLNDSLLRTNVSGALTAFLSGRRSLDAGHYYDYMVSPSDYPKLDIVGLNCIPVELAKS
ncbi:MAG: hypothetical protein JW727_04025 [Candidatus Aenigmarchaeota archaeon]|nr:hypothetical protein [Candidatus Aenigmarchaeota archaeon]